MEKSAFFPSEFCLWQLEESCGTCHLPLHLASGQENAFCPNCAIDNKNAYNGRQVLGVAKARSLQAKVIVKIDPDAPLFLIPL